MDAAEFVELFQDTYLRFHRRDDKRSELHGASRAVLMHLATTGPLTIGEASHHLARAQSVVSEIVDGLEHKGLLERMRDPRDKRRVLVWLTDAGHAALARDREVLERPFVEAALARMTDADRAALFTGLRALLHAAPRPEEKPHD
ncbi:MAG: winged helix-turn-helix transcriptional regulator [Myxococcales bacterium]|nr:winged helix-turn-helix transcriptional regulator [Myxococcales bacterium]